MERVSQHELSDADLDRMLKEAKKNENRTMRQDTGEIEKFVGRMAGDPLGDDIDKKTPWKPLSDDGIVASEGAINERRRVRGEEAPEEEQEPGQEAA